MTTTTFDGRPPSARPVAVAKRSELQAQRVRAARVFLLPMIAALALVAAWPLLRTIYFSFTDTSLNNLAGGEWVGFDNYLNVRTLSSGRHGLARHAGRSGLVERGLEHLPLRDRLGVDRDGARPDGGAGAERRVQGPRRWCGPRS